MNPQFRAFGALALAGLIWGTSDVASKVALDGVPPITLAVLRVAIALLICQRLARHSPTPPQRSGRLPLLGLLGVAGALLLQNAGLDRIGAANGSMLQGATPILIVLEAAIFLRETPGRERFAGVLVALAGIAAITLTGNNTFSSPSRGDLSVLGSAACFAAFVILGRSLFIAFDPIAILASIYGWALVFLAPLAVVEVITHGLAPVEPRTMLLVLYLGAGCSALTYFLWGYALQHIEASQAAVFDNLIPIVGIIAAAVMLRERPTTWELTGGVLVIFGAWISSQPRRPTAIRLLNEAA